MAWRLDLGTRQTKLIADPLCVPKGEAKLMVSNLEKCNMK
jgi:hypothetical protein